MTDEKTNVSQQIQYFTVRNAKPEDATSIAEILYETDPFIYPTAFEDVANAKDKFPILINLAGSAYHYSNIIVAVDIDERIVGAICYYNNSIDSCLDYYSVLNVNNNKVKHVCEYYFNRLHSYVETPDEYYIVAICVAECFRGRGLGKMLLKSVLSKTNGKRIKLDVLCNNETAIHLYKELGFQIEGISYKGYAYTPSECPDCFSMVLKSSENGQ